MICYKDMTFCADAHKCKTAPCHRRLSVADEQYAEAIGLPIALGDLSKTCKDFKEIFPQVTYAIEMPTAKEIVDSVNEG